MAVSNKNINIDDLADIRDIKVDNSLSIKDRINSLLNQTDSPYQFRVGNYTVKLSYLDSDNTIDSLLLEHIARK